MNDLAIVPFVQVNEEWILSDDFLAGIFHRIIDEDLLEIVFWDQSIGSFGDFLGFCVNQNHHICFVFKDRVCIGMCWLSGISGSYGFGHFLFFKDSWGTSTIQAGKKVIDYWFSWPGNNGALLETIVGVVPGFNARAHKFVERLGFSRLGRIPNMLKNLAGDREDAVIFYLGNEHG